MPQKRVRKPVPEVVKRALLVESGGICPKCSTSLMGKKGETNITLFDVAHIYPLNPTAHEKEILINEKISDEDIDNQKNFIALCKPCHKTYDTQLTLTEYQNLLKIKQNAVKNQNLINNWGNQILHNDILKVSDALSKLDTKYTPLTYTAVDIKRKMNNTLSFISQAKIEFFVTSFYNLIFNTFKLLETENRISVQLIYQQIKVSYLMHLEMGLDQQEIFDAMVKWINHAAGLNSIDKAEVLISFFIQNCEVFEDASS